MQCTIPHIDREGKLRFISFTQHDAIDISDNYERNSSEFEGYRIMPFDAVDLYDYNGNRVATTNSQSKNPYIIKDNSLLFALTDEGQAAEFVQQYLLKISHIQYTPCDINMIVSDLSLSVGDYIKIGDTTSIILQNTLSGSLLIEQEIQSSGGEYAQSPGKTSTPEYLSIEKKTDMMKDDIITDDLLRYAHTNDTAYEIGSVPTPIIELEIDMPNTSNLVFLATVNIETESTETREVRESVVFNDFSGELIRNEKSPVVVEGYFEWNDAVITSNKPTETYSEDGKHLLNLMYFSVGGRQAGALNKFRVFLSAKHGKVHVGAKQINATIISKGASAGNLPWDGIIKVEDKFSPITVDRFTTRLGNIVGTANTGVQVPTPYTAADTLKLITAQFDNISVAEVEDFVSPTTKS
jgi:hypothetical protein